MPAITLQARCSYYSVLMLDIYHLATVFPVELRIRARVLVLVLVENCSAFGGLSTLIHSKVSLYMTQTQS